jgi:hypothetical protein
MATGPAEKTEVSKTRVLPNFRLPRNVAGFLGDLEAEAGAEVLRNADLHLTTSFCLLICINTDVASAGGPESAAH